MLKLFFLLGLSLSTSWVWAKSPQGDSLDFEALLQALKIEARILHQDSLAENRLEASKNIDSLLYLILEFPQAKQLDVEGISRQTPEDESFDIYTWQLSHDQNRHSYGGMIRRHEEAKTIRLVDKAYEAKPAHLVLLRAKSWHGALYYKILDFKHEGETHYLLFGYHVLNFVTRRKLLEVLHFDKTGQPKFGKKVIESRDHQGRPLWVNRLILDYSASSVCNLKYDYNDNMVIFDHLISEALPEGMTAVTDGSYCGLKLQKGKWTYVEMPYPYQYDKSTSWNNPTAPMGKPLFDGQKRDILGRKKKRKP